MLRGVVTGTSSGSPCMDATSFLYTTLAIRKEYPIVIYREQAMITMLKPNYQPDSSVPCVPYFSRRNRSIPFRSSKRRFVNRKIMFRYSA